MALTPTARTLVWLRGKGIEAAVVERWIPQTRRRLDLFGFIDLIAIDGGTTWGVQATSTGNVQSRITKIIEHPNTPLWLAGPRRILVIGWRSYKRRVDRASWRPTIYEVGAAPSEGQAEEEARPIQVIGGIGATEGERYGTLSDLWSAEFR